MKKHEVIPLFDTRKRRWICAYCGRRISPGLGGGGKHKGLLRR